MKSMEKAADRRGLDLKEGTEFLYDALAEKSRKKPKKPGEEERGQREGFVPAQTETGRLF